MLGFDRGVYFTAQTILSSSAMPFWVTVHFANKNTIEMCSKHVQVRVLGRAYWQRSRTWACSLDGQSDKVNCYHFFYWRLKAIR